MAKVTGIGGVFFKSKHNDRELAKWYSEHLGFKLEDFGGAILNWAEDTANDNGLTVWHVAAKESKWFSPSQSPFMINYRVDDLDVLLAQLQSKGVNVEAGPESHENGKFAWIMDLKATKLSCGNLRPVRTNSTNNRNFAARLVAVI